MGRVTLYGPTVRNTMVTGSTTRCTETAFSLGKMAAFMKVNTKTGSNRAMEHSYGQTKTELVSLANMKACGKMVNKMAPVSTQTTYRELTKVAG
jgi:hypothetical protein